MALFRRKPMLAIRPDGRYDLNLPDGAREVLAELVTDLGDHLDDPDDPALRRLRPPAYLDDAERDAEYQLLAGDELRSSHRIAIDQVLATIEAKSLSEDDLWRWLQALNGVRLVVGTKLDISDDDDSMYRPDPVSDADERLWAVYDFTTYLQHEVVTVLGG